MHGLSGFHDKCIRILSFTIELGLGV